MTLQEAAKEAIVVQDACNLSGVVHKFSQILTEVLWPEARKQEKGTDWVNRHPISIMFTDKIASLSCRGSLVDFSKAYDEVKVLAKGVVV